MNPSSANRELRVPALQDAPSITKSALDKSDPLAVEAVDMFLAIIGAEAGYMGLRALASGGVYLCGGITPKVPFQHTNISTC
jgi:glucokinase